MKRQDFFRAQRRHPNGQAARMVTTLALASILLSMLLGACANSGQTAASQAKNTLDKAITDARAKYNVPESLLKPIIQQEQATAAATAHTSSPDWTKASATYSDLYQKVLAIEKMSPADARALAQKDLQALDTGVRQIKKAGFVEADGYAQRYQQAKSQLATASTTKDIFRADSAIQGQITAVSLVEPIYQELQALDKQVATQDQLLGVQQSGPQPLLCATGRNTNSDYWYVDTAVTVQNGSSAPAPAYHKWHDADLNLFRNATTPEDLQRLQTLIHAQRQQLTASATAAMPSIADKLVKAFQADVQTYLQNGGKDTTFQHLAAQDAQALAKAKTSVDFSSLVQTVEKQRQDFQLPAIKAQMQHDFAAFKQLVAQGQAHKTVDPANGVAYPDAYEYAAPDVGIGDVEGRLQNAQSYSDYVTIDREIQMLQTNLQAMLDNLNDPTPADQPHKTDIRLMQHYGITSTRAIVVSLREQEARMYDNGKLVRAYKVTTGDPQLASPPGIHCVFQKVHDIKFISPDPPGSPNYYNPTPIHWGLLYSYYGYFLHDAWWRAWFGKYSNLPHYDPISFNNGSHGCINFPLSKMQWLYDWASIGTPVIVY